jgi:hypothetical protein
MNKEQLQTAIDAVHGDHRDRGYSHIKTAAARRKIDARMSEMLARRTGAKPIWAYAS